MLARKFGGNDQAAVTLSITYLLNKVKDPLLPYFHYFFLMFHYCSYLISVLLSLQNYSSLLVVRLLPLYGKSLTFQWNEGTDESFVVKAYPNSKIRVKETRYPYGTKFCGLYCMGFLSP